MYLVFESDGITKKAIDSEFSEVEARKRMQFYADDYSREGYTVFETSENTRFASLFRTEFRWLSVEKALED